MNRLLLFTAAFVLVTFSAFRTMLPTESPRTLVSAPKRINWMTIEQAYALTQKRPKKFVVDVYTDWCGWCKVMDRETFTRPAIVDSPFPATWSRACFTRSSRILVRITTRKNRSTSTKPEPTRKLFESR